MMKKFGDIRQTNLEKQEWSYVEYKIEWKKFGNDQNLPKVKSSKESIYGEYSNL